MQHSLSQYRQYIFSEVNENNLKHLSFDIWMVLKDLQAAPHIREQTAHHHLLQQYMVTKHGRQINPASLKQDTPKHTPIKGWRSYTIQQQLIEHEVTRVNHSLRLPWQPGWTGGNLSLHSPHHATAGMRWLLHEPSSPIFAGKQQWAEEFIPRVGALCWPPAEPSTPGSLGPKWECWRELYSSCDTGLFHAASTHWLPPLMTQLSYFTLKSVWEAFFREGMGNGRQDF